METNPEEKMNQLNSIVNGFLFGIGMIIAAFVMNWIFKIGFCS
jgi:uncharacterized membrane protein (DUF485 family)